MRDKLLVEARHTLQPLWEKACLKGRCWGPKREGNPFSGSNITFAVEGELVSISQEGNGLVIHEFSEARNTSLGKKVREILQKEV